MKEQLQKRLTELKQEFESGQKMLAELEEKRNSLQNTMLRISGAMQVLQEQLKPEGEAPVDFDSENEINNHHEEPVSAE